MKYPIIFYVDLYSNLLPFSIAIYRRKAIWADSEGARLVFAFTVLATLTEFANSLMSINHIRNYWVLHSYIFVEFGLLITIFSKWFQESRHDAREYFRKPTWFALSPTNPYLIILLYGTLWLFSKWTFEKWDEPPRYAIGLSTMLFIILSLISLFKMIRKSTSGAQSLVRSFRFWVVSGILFYFAGSAIDFLLLPVMAGLPRDVAMGIWEVHMGVDIVANLFYTIGYLCLIKP